MRSNEPVFNNSIELGNFLDRKGLREKETCPPGSSAVLIPILEEADTLQILLEVRSFRLRSQPGEICFPGGRIEAGETPLETAVREATEELCIDRGRIEIVGALDDTIGPGTIPLFTYIALLHDYQGTRSRAEVDAVFTQPLDWILANDPEIYRINLERKMPEDFNLPNVMLTTYFTYFHEKIAFRVITFKPRQGGVNSINFKKIFKIGWKALWDFRNLKKHIND